MDVTRQVRSGIALGMLFIISLLVATTAFAAPTLKRTMSEEAHPGDLFEVVYAVSGITSKDLFSLEDTLPAGFTVANWTVTGQAGDRESILTRQKDNAFAWSFNASGTKATINAIVSVPDNAALANYTFSSVWFDSSGFSKDERVIEITKEIVSNTTKPASKKVVKSTAKKSTSPTGASTWAGTDMDLYTAWGVGFFVLMFGLIIGMYYFYNRLS